MSSDESACERFTPTYTFTVFTPTWNRVQTLPAVFSCLRAQSFQDFEWLVVDDGSSDGTDTLLQRLQLDGGFPIRYLRQEHAGKPAAFVRGVRAARGKLFLTLDSDDTCIPTALERLKYHWDSIPPLHRADFSAVTGLTVDELGQIIGTKFPRDPLDSNSLECWYRWGVRGEKWGFQRTDILKEYVPQLLGNSPAFVPEGIVWTAIARRYRTRYVNEPLRRMGSASLGAPRLTRSSPREHADGMAYWYQTVLNEHIGWIRFAPTQFLRSGANYARFSFHAAVPIALQGSRLRTRYARALWLIGLPVGGALFMCDRRRLRVMATTEDVFL